MGLLGYITYIYMDIWEMGNMGYMGYMGYCIYNYQVIHLNRWIYIYIYMGYIGFMEMRIFVRYEWD
jgi:hypothetical protein